MLRITQQFTKTAGLASVAGIIAIMYAFENKKWNWGILVLGGFLTVMGSMIRFESFGLALILMCILGLSELLHKLILYKYNSEERIRNCFGYVSAFVVILCIVAGTKYVDFKAYESKPEWNKIREFNARTTVLLDYGFPSYNEYAEDYARLGLTENDMHMFSSWNFADMDFFTIELLDKMIEIKEKYEVPFGIDDLKYFFRDNVKRFFTEKSFCAFLIVLFLWFVLCRKNYVVVIGTLFVTLGLNLYFQYLGRILVNRVDVVIWLACLCVIVYAAGDCLLTQKNERLLISLAGVLIIINSNNYLNHIDENRLEREHRGGLQTFCEAVTADTENFYLVDTSSNLVSRAYSIFDRVPYGVYCNYYLLGGWETYSPIKLNALYLHNVSNPFRDIVNNEKIYLIDNCGEIDSKITYIREHYDENAQASLVKQFGENNIYKIYSKPLVLDVSDAITDSPEVVNYVTISEDGDNVTIDGTVYVPGENSFQQNLYIMVQNKENGDIKYLYTCQKESSSRESIYDGRYSNFTCLFNKTEIGMDNYEVKVLLDSTEKKYLITTPTVE